MIRIITGVVCLIFCATGAYIIHDASVLRSQHDTSIRLFYDILALGIPGIGFLAWGIVALCKRDNISYPTFSWRIIAAVFVVMIPLGVILLFATITSTEAHAIDRTLKVGDTITVAEYRSLKNAGYSFPAGPSDLGLPDNAKLALMGPAEATWVVRTTEYKPLDYWMLGLGCLAIAAGGLGTCWIKRSGRCVEGIFCK